MELTTLTAHLDSDRRAQRLVEVVAELEAAVASGVVPNKLFTDAKDQINRAVEGGAEGFIAKGPHVVGRNGQPHHQTDWWLAAYDADAFVRGAHTLPTVLKRAQKAGKPLAEYAAFVATLIPLRDLLDAAKPLIRKRGELPKVKTAKQIADDAKRMTCQCCGRGIFAERGAIAHHGYERPGHGWQTASCMGAKALPFEVSRDKLGEWIDTLKGLIVQAEKYLPKVHAETVPMPFGYSVPDGNNRYRRIDKTVNVTRAWFVASDDNESVGPFVNEWNRGNDYDRCKKHEIARVESELRMLRADLKAQQARYDGWKQTHQWVAGQWEAL